MRRDIERFSSPQEILLDVATARAAQAEEAHTADLLLAALPLSIGAVLAQTGSRIAEDVAGFGI